MVKLGGPEEPWPTLAFENFHLQQLLSLISITIYLLPHPPLNFRIWPLTMQNLHLKHL